MPYDENSFLQGLAVGRSLKGVSVIAGGGGGGRVRISGSGFGLVMNIPNLEAALTHDEAGTAEVLSTYIEIIGESIESSQELPGTLGIGGITASAVLTIDE